MCVYIERYVYANYNTYVCIHTHIYIYIHMYVYIYTQYYKILAPGRGEDPGEQGLRAGPRPSPREAITNTTIQL